MKERVPVAGFSLAAQVKEAFGVFFEPEHSGSLEAQIDDTADGAFDGARTDGYAPRDEIRIVNVFLVFEEVIKFGAEFFIAGFFDGA